MKIGIMGGTFDPIHIGHLILAQQAKEQFELDSICFMPNGNPRYKQEQEVTSAEHRSRMVELAVSQNPSFGLDLMEVQRDGYTYTCDTLLELKKLHPQDSFFFILGADSLFAIETWKKPELIAQNCTILAANRDNRTRPELENQIMHLHSKYQMKAYLMDTPLLDISSHMIRQKVRLGESIRYYVPDSVRDYILQQNLYQKN